MNQPIVTDRLILRRWRDDDLAPFAALNADPEVMEFFPAPLARAESDELAARIDSDLAEIDFGLWALELRSTGEFIGFTGLSIPGFVAPFTPCVEIGWRLARPAWGRGLASEAARESLRQGFAEHGLAEIVSFTYEGNRRSRAVMERVGMTSDPADDFEHPRMPGHRMARHVLYRLTAGRWRAEGLLSPRSGRPDGSAR
ncbi:MAG: GNAT family N-acetyltransferase [Acidimicrobiales bacterium]